MKLVIYLDFEDGSDFDWLRTRAVGVVEDLVIEQDEEGRLDGKVEVSWDVED